MTRFALAAAALAVIGASQAGATYHGQITFPEEQAARAEKRLIIASPIGGIRNSRWYNYRANIGEAEKELANDLRGADDAEDVREVWDEYRGELRGERREYIREMAERGYRYGRVEVLD